MPTKQEVMKMLLDAISKMCVECAADGDVQGCMGEDCSLFPARLGIPPPRKKHGWLIQVVRERCLDCCNDQAREVLCCEAYKCPLWPWREGTGIPVTPERRKGVDAILFGDEDPDELTANDVLFGDGE